MTECIVCYNDIKNKVSLECSHELCLKCFTNILKSNYIFSCPMCRHKYNDIYLKDEEQVFESLPPDYVFDPGYEINITQEQYSIFQEIIASCFPDYTYKYYRTSVNNNVFCFALIYNIDVEDNIIEHLLFSLLTDQLPQEDNYIKNLKQGMSNVGNYKMISTSCYLQDYHDIIIKKIEYL